MGIVMTVTCDGGLLFRNYGGVEMTRQAWVSAVVLMVSISSVSAQTTGHWNSPDLQAKHVTPEQYKSIGNGYLLQCQSKTMADLRQQLIAAHQQCEQQMGGQNLMCVSQDQDRQAQAQRMFPSLMQACMSEHGWFWTDD